MPWELHTNKCKRSIVVDDSTLRFGPSFRVVVLRISAALLNAIVGVCHHHFLFKRFTCFATPHILSTAEHHMRSGPGQRLICVAPAFSQLFFNFLFNGQIRFFVTFNSPF